MHEFWLGILGGIVAWVATMLVGHPFYELLNLRRETAQLLHLYEPPKMDSRATMASWIEDRANAYRTYAAKLFAFDSSETLVVAIAKLPPFKWDLKKAAEYFWQLAPLGPGASERAQLRSGIGVALKLRL
jgi:hypothetical protein